MKPHFRILTYNIHKCIGGVDRKYDPDRVAETIDHYQPDIVLLQEVDRGVPRSRFDVQVELLAEQLGYEHQGFQSNVRLTRGSYGNAILSRHAIEMIHHCDLTIPLKKRRRALISHIRVRHDGHSRRLVIANVHLGLAGFERVLQIRKLLNHETIARTRKSTPTIIAGDFNDMWLSLETKLLVPAGFEATGKAKTFPAIYPVRALDRIFYRGTISLLSTFHGYTQLARNASDHLPLIADFSIDD